LFNEWKWQALFNSIKIRMKMTKMTKLITSFHFICSFLVRRLKPAFFICHMVSPMIICARCAAVRGDFILKSSWLVLIALFFQTASAQDSLSTSSLKTNKWNYRVEPYLLLPNMVGNTGISPLPLAEVDANSGDIFERLKFGAMLNFEATNGTWTIGSDFLYMNLEQDFERGQIIQGGKVNMKQLGWEVAGLRRINSWLDLGVGLLLNSLKAEGEMVRLTPGGGNTTLQGSQSKTWLDPMIIARLSTPGKRKIFGQFRGEIGGFGIGSDLAWQVQAVGGYRFSKLFDISAGYRAISLDYTSGEGNKSFVYDMITHGPTVKFGFSF
jgi:hypothetical protein